MKIEIIRAKCTGCGLCWKVCPVEAIHMVEGKAHIDYDTCILCGACAEVCPENAIIFEKPLAETKNLSAYKDVWVFCEQINCVTKPVSFELLGKGRELADARGSNLCGVLFGKDVAKCASKLFEFGADRVYVVNSPELEYFRDDSYAIALTELIKLYKPEIVLAGATTIGRSFIPRVAAHLKTGLTADCTDLATDDEGNLIQTRPAFGGNIMADILCTRNRPQMATVRPRVMKPLKRDPARSGEVIVEEIRDEKLSSTMRMLESIDEIDKTAELESAEIVVVGGAGMGKAENFSLIRDLASILGAAVGATRTIVDRGWVPYSLQIGQTGKTVCPKLYIAIGVSGAIQHIVGMQTSDKILAINKDPHAPIFRMADYGLVGDLFEIIPKLIEDLRGSINSFVKK